MVAGVREAARARRRRPEDVELILNGTTVVTNTVIEQRGARVGLLITRGFRYVLEIARSWTPGPVSGWMVWEKPAPLADTRLVREIGGRIDADGTELEPLDEDDVRARGARAARRAASRRSRSRSIHGYLRPDLEARVGEWAAEEAPGPADLARLERRCPSRASTSARWSPSPTPTCSRRCAATCRSVEGELRRSFPRAELNIVRSDGGVMSGEDAIERPDRDGLLRPRRRRARRRARRAH